MDNRYVQQFKKGSLEMILLCLIGRKETYGYEIITAVSYTHLISGRKTKRKNHKRSKAA